MGIITQLTPAADGVSDYYPKLTTYVQTAAVHPPVVNFAVPVLSAQNFVVASLTSVAAIQYAVAVETPTEIVDAARSVLIAVTLDNALPQVVPGVVPKQVEMFAYDELLLS